MALTNEVKEIIIKNKLQVYEQQYYGLQIEMEVIQDIDDKQGEELIKAQMVKVKKIIKQLEIKLKDLEKAVE